MIWHVITKHCLRISSPKLVLSCLRAKKHASRSFVYQPLCDRNSYNSMIHNNDISNTDDNIGNIPQSNGTRDVTVPEDKFLFKEPIVLISIVCLSVLNDLSLFLQPWNLDGMPRWISTVFSVSISAGPVVGALFAAFLSEVTGRKPVYIYLYALSVFSFILLASSNHAKVVCLIMILQGIIRGGSSVMNALAIIEYSSPKYRFAWMIANVAATNTLASIKPILNLTTDIVFSVLLVIQIVLRLICLGSTWVWPESPYWLASKGKLEQSRMAFMWLRGKGGREELASVLKARRRPGPPKLFRISLSIALATISVSIFSWLQAIQSSLLYHYSISEFRKQQPYIHLLSNTVFYSILAAVSYFVKRKLLFIVVCVISFILSYAEAFWMHLTSGSNLDSVLSFLLHNASDVIRSCGPAVFGIILFIEIAPYKYNTIISCICFIVMFSCFRLLFKLTFYLDYPFVLLAMFTTFSLFAALLYYFFAPETKDKTLLEIERSYTPEENDSNSELNQSMMLNVI